MLNDIERLIREEDGAAGLEYTLLAALVVIILAAFIASISGVAENIWNAVSGSFDEADRDAN